jgi:large subunit ribosomal protein L35
MEPTGVRACRGGSKRDRASFGLPAKESKMPKLKTKSSAKKRFRFTAGGKIRTGQAGKRHGMIKRSNEQIRNLRGTTILDASETQRIRRWMPYSQ